MSQSLVMAGEVRRAAVEASCQATLKRGSKSFALAARLLPPRTRHDAAVLYAFCRNVDDAIDLATPGSEQHALDAVRLRVRSVFRGETQSEPFWRSFAELVRRTRLPSTYVNELLLGMQMDVDGRRYATFDELLLYCHRVAGVVGLMMCHVLGVTRDSALRNAAHLGIALQLTNIARDVDEDWRRGRLYLPRELLARAGLADLEPAPTRSLNAAEASALSRAVSTLLDAADGFYRSGDLGLSALPGRARFAVRTARLVYARIGVLLRARGCAVLSGRVVVPTHHKLILLARAAWSSLIDAWRGEPSARARLPNSVLRFAEDILPGESHEAFR